MLAALLTGSLLSILFWVIILGLIAWVISILPIPQPFKVVGYVILIITLLVLLAGALGVAL